MSNSPYIFFLVPPDLLPVELMLTSLLEGAFGISWGPFKLLNDMSAHASMPPKKNIDLAVVSGSRVILYPMQAQHCYCTNKKIYNPADKVSLGLFLG